MIPELEIIVIRHAEPELKGLYIGAGSDPALSQAGREQAGRLAEQLEQSAPEVIIASPQQRAVQSARPLARRLGKDIVCMAEFSEIRFGDWEGLHWTEIQRRFPKEWTHWLKAPWLTAPPGGETLKDLHRRVTSSLIKILNHYKQTPIVVFSHAGPIRSILAFSFQIQPTAAFFPALDYASQSRFLFHRPDSLQLVRWNWTSSL